MHTPIITEEVVKKVIADFDKPDAPMSDDFRTNIENFRRWNWYDNYQHGEFIDENDAGYGPIKVFNARVLIGQRAEFHGDVSERRFNWLKSLSEKFKVPVEIYYERGPIAHKFEGDDKNFAVLLGLKE